MVGKSWGVKGGGERLWLAGTSWFSGGEVLVFCGLPTLYDGPAGGRWGTPADTDASGFSIGGRLGLSVVTVFVVTEIESLVDQT